jgi:superfamily II DNA or RNA helicase
MDQIILRSGVYIPSKFIDTDKAVDTYTTHMFVDEICNKCEHLDQRPCVICEECEHGGYKGSICTIKEVRKKGTSYYKFPIGDRLEIEAKLDLNFDHFKIRDLRCNEPFRSKVKFTGVLRDYQIPVFQNWLKYGYGLTKSAPRTGKTVMGVAGCIALGRRTLIVADQKDFLDGFFETIMGGVDTKPMTNLPKLETKQGKKLVGFVKTQEDFESFEIGLCTIQSFYAGSSGRDRLKWANSNFGTLIIDEVHRGNASEFSRTISKLAMKYKFGLTATPERKDGKSFLIEQLIGPITSSTTEKALNPKIYIYETEGVKSRSKYSGPAGFTYCENFLSAHEDRNALLVASAIRDIKAGRSIVMPLKRRQHIHDMVDTINKKMGREVAAEFVGGAKSKKRRKEVIAMARSGKIKIVVGYKPLLQLGLNVPRWDTLYYIMPMNNLPNWEQESCRICTPFNNKKPIVRMFADPEIGLSIGCFRKTVKHSIDLGHLFSRQANRKLVGLMAGSREAYLFKDMDFLDHTSTNVLSYGKAKKSLPYEGLGLKSAGKSVGRRFGGGVSE